MAKKIKQTNVDISFNEVKSSIGFECHFWNELPTGVKHNINQAKAELDRGEGIPHSAVMKEIRSRFHNI